MAKVILIAAIDAERGIGKDGDIPWNAPFDLQFFKFMTIGKPIVMGRKTYESIGKPLKDRTTVLVTTNSTYKSKSYNDRKLVIANNKDDLYRYVNLFKVVYICGGSTIYNQFITNAHELVLTNIKGAYNCDTFFPPYKEIFKKRATLSEFKDDQIVSIEKWKRVC